MIVVFYYVYSYGRTQGYFLNDTLEQRARVSWENEDLILVNENDKIMGYNSKAACHKGIGILHRAFSLFIFNQRGELLLQQRSAQKRLWPLYWSNSCCSHPKRGEEMDKAITRRLQQELGLACKLSYLYKFQYQVSFADKGAEHELCSVYFGQSDKKPRVNVNEIVDYRYINISDLEQEMKNDPERFTPWFQMEWKHLRETFKEELQSLVQL